MEISQSTKPISPPSFSYFNSTIKVVDPMWWITRRRRDIDLSLLFSKIDNWTREREREKGDKVPVSAVFPLLFQAILSKGQRQNQREFVFPLSRAVPRKINAITCTFFFFRARGKKLGIIYHFNRRGSRWIWHRDKEFLLFWRWDYLISFEKNINCERIMNLWGIVDSNCFKSFYP